MDCHEPINNRNQTVVKIGILLIVVITLRYFFYEAFTSTSQSVQFSKGKRNNYQKCTSKFESYQDLLDSKNLRRGDLIECKKALGVYDHWAIYIGKDEENQEDVIHLTVLTIGAEIRRDHFKKVAGKSKCRVNNLKRSALERGLNPRSREAVARCAIGEWEKFRNKNMGQVTYNLLDSNCEHFATFCAFGASFSDQADIVRDKSAINYIGRCIANFSTIVSTIYISSSEHNELY